MIQTLKIIVTSLLLGAGSMYAYLTYFQNQDNKFEQENRRLNRHVDSLMAENKKMELTNAKWEDSIIVIKKQRADIQQTIKYVFQTSSELTSAPVDVVADKVEEVFEKSAFHSYDSSYFKTTPKIANGIKEYPIFLIDKMVAIDYLFKDKMISTYTQVIDLADNENRLLTQQKENYIKEISNYQAGMNDQKQIIQNTNSLWQSERKKRKLFEAIAYGTAGATVLLSVKQKPTIALPVGLIISAGKFFLFN